MGSFLLTTLLVAFGHNTTTTSETAQRRSEPSNGATVEPHVAVEHEGRTLHAHSPEGQATPPETHTSAPGVPRASVRPVFDPKFEYAFYVKMMLGRIQQHWQRIPIKGIAVVVLRFKIHTDGTVTDPTFEQSSGTPVLDRAAFRAVLSASPMPPLPTSYPHEDVTVHLRFTYTDSVDEPGASAITALDPDFEYAYYVKAILGAIDQHWTRSAIRGNPAVVVRFAIQRNGLVRGATVEQSSGSNLVDRAALKAVLLASPLPPLPNSYQHERVDIRLRFTDADSVDVHDSAPVSDPIDVPGVQQSVSGVFREFRCVASDHFEFVISNDERTYVFYATSAGAFSVIENGSWTKKDLHCGRQFADVTASYVPKSESPIGSEVHGELKVLRFMKR